VVNHGYFNVEEILKFHSGYYGITNNKERIDSLLHELRLWDHRKKNVRQLSGGMKRRLMIAKALVHEPRLLLLDEPTAGVDIELRTQLWEFIKRLRKEGVTVLLTTHYLEEAESLCDRVGIIDKGELKMLGQTRSLIAKMTVRNVRVKFRGMAQPTQYSLATGQTVGELFVEKQIDVKSIEDVSIDEGTLEDAFRRVVYQ
jgi:ABC-2 type transport system ATP-binding protein